MKTCMPLTTFVAVRKVLEVEEKVPIKWMAPESIKRNLYNEKTDVVRVNYIHNCIYMEKIVYYSKLPKKHYCHRPRTHNHGRSHPFDYPRSNRKKRKKPRNLTSTIQTFLQNIYKTHNTHRVEQLGNQMPSLENWGGGLKIFYG